MKTVNFKGAVPTQDDVNMKRNRILLMLYVACNMLLGPFCCLCFVCVSALDHEFQDSRGLCAVAQPHHLQSATDVLWITDESQSWRRKKRPVSDKKKWNLVAQSYLAVCDPMDCSLPGFFIYGIFQARILEWVTISFSRGSSRPRDWTQVSSIADRFFTVCATREDQWMPKWISKQFVHGETDWLSLSDKAFTVTSVV